MVCAPPRVPHPSWFSNKGFSREQVFWPIYFTAKARVPEPSNSTPDVPACFPICGHGQAHKIDFFCLQKQIDLILLCKNFWGMRLLGNPVLNCRFSMERSYTGISPLARSPLSHWWGCQCYYQTGIFMDLVFLVTFAKGNPSRVC